MTAHSFDYSTAKLLAAMSDPLGRTPEGESVSVSPEDVRALARAAYEQNEPQARSRAERLLYAMHVHTGYAQPTAPIPSFVWSVLMQHKLRAELGAFLKEPEISAETMNERLAAAVKVGFKANDTVLEVITELKAVPIWTKYTFLSVDGFTQGLAAVAQRSTGEVQKVIVHNMDDEVYQEHPKSRAKFAERVGIRLEFRGIADDPDESVPAFAAANYRAGISLLASPWFALGAFYTIEAVVPHLHVALVPKLKSYGLEDPALQLFHSHSTGDLEHAKEWIDMLNKANLDGKSRAFVAAGAGANSEHRVKLFEDIRARILRLKK